MPQRRRTGFLGTIPLRVDRLALVLTLLALAALVAYRVYNFWVTGFVVSDEYGYIYYAMYPTPNNAAYGYRLFFGAINTWLFQTLGINNLDAFLRLLPFYLFFWSGLTVFLFYKIVKNLGFDYKTVALTVPSVLLIPTFDLMSVGFLSEPVGLAMGMLGIYFIVKFASSGGGYARLLLYPLLSSLSFVAATYTREPYVIYAIAGFLPLSVLALNRNRVRTWKGLPAGKLGTPARVALLISAIVLFEVTGFYLIHYSDATVLSQMGTIQSSFLQVLSNPVLALSLPSGQAAGSGIPPTSAVLSVVNSPGPPSNAKAQDSSCPAPTVTVTSTNSSTTTSSTTATSITSMISATSTTSTTTSTTKSTTTTSTTSTTSTSTSTSISTASGTTTSSSTTSATTTTTSTTTASATSSSTASSTAPATSSFISSATSATQSFKSTTASSSGTQAELVITPRLAQTASAFLIGLILGWGPAAILISLIGGISLLLGTIRKNQTYFSILILAFISLTAYFAVAFVFSPDVNYLTPEHYSTLIRFSNAALPAYFLAAPFAVVSIRKNRRLAISVVLLVLVTLTAIPVYQTFAASNLNLGQNPFSLDYKTPGVVIRDYVTSHSGSGPFNVVGASRDGWFWTPGSSAITNVHFYPSLSQTLLMKQRWQTFYVFGSDEKQVTCEIKTTLVPGAANGDYQVVSQNLVLAENGYYMVRAQLLWRGG